MDYSYWTSKTLADSNLLIVWLQRWRTDTHGFLYGHWLVDVLVQVLEVNVIDIVAYESPLQHSLLSQTYSSVPFMKMLFSLYPTTDVNGTDNIRRIRIWIRLEGLISVPALTKFGYSIFDIIPKSEYWNSYFYDIDTYLYLIRHIWYYSNPRRKMTICIHIRRCMTIFN